MLFRSHTQPPRMHDMRTRGDERTSQTNVPYLQDRHGLCRMGDDATAVRQPPSALLLLPLHSHENRIPLWTTRTNNNCQRSEYNGSCVWHGRGFSTGIFQPGSQRVSALHAMPHDSTHTGIRYLRRVASRRALLTLLRLSTKGTAHWDTFNLKVPQWAVFVRSRTTRATCPAWCPACGTGSAQEWHRCREGQTSVPTRSLRTH